MNFDAFDQNNYEQGMLYLKLSQETTVTPKPGPTSDPSSVYEDPHFHVRGLSAEQPDLCFDYDGIPGHDMTIISDSGPMLKF